MKSSAAERLASLLTHFTKYLQYYAFLLIRQHLILHSPTTNFKTNRQASLLRILRVHEVNLYKRVYFQRWWRQASALSLIELDQGRSKYDSRVVTQKLKFLSCTVDGVGAVSFYKLLEGTGKPSRGSTLFKAISRPFRRSFIRKSKVRKSSILSLSTLSKLSYPQLFYQEFFIKLRAKPVLLGWNQAWAALQFSELLSRKILYPMLAAWIPLSSHSQQNTLMEQQSKYLLLKLSRMVQILTMNVWKHTPRASTKLLQALKKQTKVSSPAQLNCLIKAIERPLYRLGAKGFQKLIRIYHTQLPHNQVDTGRNRYLIEVLSNHLHVGMKVAEREKQSKQGMGGPLLWYVGWRHRKRVLKESWHLWGERVSFPAKAYHEMANLLQITEAQNKIMMQELY